MQGVGVGGGGGGLKGDLLPQLKSIWCTCLPTVVYMPYAYSRIDLCTVVDIVMVQWIYQNSADTCKYSKAVVQNL